MRVAVAIFVAALVCAAVAEDAKQADAPKETLVAAESKKSSRSSEQAPKVYYAKPAQQQQPAQARDGAHHHHHEHHPIHDTGYAQAAPAAAYPQQPAYEQPAAYPQPAAPAYEQPAPQAYEQPAPQGYPQPQAYEQPQAYPQPAAPAYEQPAPAAYPAAAPIPAATGYEAAPAPAPAYSTPGHQGYYYYYYPVKDHKIKLKMPKIKMPKLPSLPSLHLPEYYGKDGGVSRVGTYGVAALTAALVGVGAFLSLPIIGLGAGKRSFSSLWESEYLNRDNLNVLAEYVLNMVDSYQPAKQQ